MGYIKKSVTPKMRYMHLSNKNFDCVPLPLPSLPSRYRYRPVTVPLRIITIFGQRYP
jgi:hypothetical protein